MPRLTVIAAVVAALVGILGGYVWWGAPTGRLETELRDARSGVERLGRQLDDERAERKQLEAQLEAEKARRETLEMDLKREKQVSARLHRLVSEGKK